MPRPKPDLRVVVYNRIGDPEARCAVLAGDEEAAVFARERLKDKTVVEGSVDILDSSRAKVTIQPPRMLDAEVVIHRRERPKNPRKRRAATAAVPPPAAPANGTQVDPPVP